MNMDCFMKRYVDILMNDKNDHTFETIKILTGGTTSPRIAKLLNFAVSQMDKDEVYLEVGVFSGTTLVSAAHVNGKKCIGIDNFDEAEHRSMGCDPAIIKERCLHNIRQSNSATNLIENDFRSVTREDIVYPVAVSFIDGRHDFPSVTENLKWLEPMLADEAIVVFDDVNYMEVSQAIFDWLNGHPKTWDLVSYEKPFFFNDNYTSSVSERFLNNGVCILNYHRNPLSKYFVVGNPNYKGAQSAN